MIKNRYRVLLIEDSAWDARVATEALADSARATIEVQHATSLTAAHEALEKGSFDAVIADLNLPDSAGVATLRALRDAAPSATAIIALTGVAGDEMGPESIEAGADEFVPKSIVGDLGAEVLPRAVRFAVEQRAARARASRTSRGSTRRRCRRSPRSSRASMRTGGSRGSTAQARWRSGARLRTSWGNIRRTSLLPRTRRGSLASSRRTTPWRRSPRS